VTVRGQQDDFEYVLANRSSTLSENLRMQRFMYLARILGENQYFKRLWAPARRLAGLSQSQVIMSLRAWLDRSQHPGGPGWIGRNTPMWWPSGRRSRCWPNHRRSRAATGCCMSTR
jgi:hypothetical protein